MKRVLPGYGKPKYIAFLNHKPLGNLDSKSINIFVKQYREAAVNLSVNLNSFPSSSAIFKTDSNSIIYLWQAKFRTYAVRKAIYQETDLDRARSFLRQTFQDYADRVKQIKPNIADQLSLDLNVALLASSDGYSFVQTAAILSASDTLISMRPEPHSPQWNDYEKKAKQYVLKICKSIPSLNPDSSLTKGQEMSL